MVHKSSKFTMIMSSMAAIFPQWSTINQSEAESNLLRRGLNFIPTPPREHPATILQDYLLFDWKLRLGIILKTRKPNPRNKQKIQY